MRARVVLLVVLFGVGMLAAGALAAPGDEGRRAARLAKVPDWGPSTPADSLAARLRSARQLDDAALFAVLRDSLWALRPHDDAVIAQVAKWRLEHGEALAPGVAGDPARLAVQLGLPGLDRSDALLLAAEEALVGGYLATAGELCGKLAAETPPRPAVLASLVWLKTRTATTAGELDAALDVALVAPEAARDVLMFMASSLPGEIWSEWRDAAQARLAELPPRPRIEQDLALVHCRIAIRRPGLTPQILAGHLDTLHRRSPGQAAANLDDLLSDALAWLAPTDVTPVLESRLAWLTPSMQRRCRYLLAHDAARGHEAYRILLEGVADGRRPVPGDLPALTPIWHADAQAAAAWARALVPSPLGTSFQDLAHVLEMAGHRAEADSVRAIGARERPLTRGLERLYALSTTDPSAAFALLDSLDRQWPPFILERARLHLAEATGDTTILARVLREGDPFEVADLLRLAADGARQLGDLARLERLAGLVAQRTSRRLEVRRQWAALALDERDLAAAERALAGIPATGRDWRDIVLHLRTALLSGRTERARALMASFLDEPDLDAADLLDVPLNAEAYGWPDLADRAVARLQTLAPGAPATALTVGQLLTERRDLAGARAALQPAAAGWTGAPYFRNALAATGNAMENYVDPAPDRGGSVFGGLGLEYAETDWIRARATAAASHDGAGQVILQDRHSVVFAAADRLIYRHRMVTQLFSDDATEQFTPYRFTFTGGTEPPRVICARVITPEGDVREVRRSDILVTAHQGDDADVSDQRDLVIPFPNLRPGVIVDLCVEVMPGASFAGASWVHHFGNMIPQVEETLEFVVAPGVAHTLGDDQAPGPVEHLNLAAGRGYRWTTRDVPAIEPEEAAPPFSLYPAWAGCTTVASWQEVGRRYGSDFWTRVEVDQAIAEQAKLLVAGARDDATRLARLFDYVKDEIDAVGVEVGRGRFVPSSSVEVMRRRYGDCKEKVALLTALARAVGVECRPVLVGVRPSESPVDDFPSGSCFNHLVAFMPSIAGGIFCDPTLGDGCVTDLPPAVCGQRGLVIAPNGNSHLVTLPEHDDTDAELRYVIDLRPQANGDLEATVDITARHDTAHLTGSVLAAPDTASAARVAAYMATPQTTSGFELRRWEHDALPCGDWHLVAVLRDSAWVSAGEHDGTLTWLSLADDCLSLPDTRDRKLPVAMDEPQWTSVTIRAHQMPGWQLDPHVAPVRLEGPGLRGEVTVTERRSGDDVWLEIHRELHLTRREWSAADFPAMAARYSAYKLGCLQPIAWRRREDETRLTQLVDYARANPGDVGFAIQAAQQLLGSDLGGDGAAGRARREQVRSLLAPVLAAGGSDAAPFLVMARMARRDDHWLEADSLLTHALTLAPREPGLLGAAAYVKEALSRYAEAIDLTRRQQSISGGSGPSYTVIRLLLALGRDDEAAREVERLRLLDPDLSEFSLLVARFTGYGQSRRLQEAARVMNEGRRLLAENGIRAMNMDLASHDRRWDDAAALADSACRESPLDASVNNNLAWFLACAGRDLDRAEYAIGVASSISGGSKRDNTLALVMLRQGRLMEARALLRELLADDRPSSRIANGYLLGLSYWWEGDREQALAAWEPHAQLTAYGVMDTVIRDALAAVAEGRDPSWLYVDRAPGKR